MRWRFPRGTREEAEVVQSVLTSGRWILLDLIVYSAIIGWLLSSKLSFWLTSPIFYATGGLLYLVLRRFFQDDSEGIA